MHAAGGPLPLRELAHTSDCSTRQLQRDFEDILGVSPREYGASVRAMNARHVLRSADSITDAIYDAGYGSVRAFYEKASTRLGMTPSDFGRCPAAPVDLVEHELDHRSIDLRCWTEGNLFVVTCERRCILA